MTKNAIDGKWIHRSYYSEAPFKSINEIKPEELIWATGELEATTDNNGLVSGKLKFPSNVQLTVEGQITPGVDGQPDRFEAIGEHNSLSLRYSLEAWFVPAVSNVPESIKIKQTPTILGSITNLGDIDPSKPKGYVGSFILVKKVTEE